MTNELNHSTSMPEMRSAAGFGAPGELEREATPCQQRQQCQQRQLANKPQESGGDSRFPTFWQTDSLRQEWRPFPTELLPPRLAAYVQAESEATVVDESMVALPLLVALAAAIGGSRQAGVKRGWTEPCILWGALIAPASSGKTPAAQNILEVVRERDHQAYAAPPEKWDAAFTAQQLKLELADLNRVTAEFAAKQLADLEALVRGGTIPTQEAAEDLTPSGALNASPAEQRPAKLVLPPPTRYYLQDATTEQLLSVLEDNPRGVLMVRDELSGLFGSFAQGAQGRGSVDRSKYLSIWSAEHLSDDRKAARSTYVRRPHVSLYGGVQPDLLFRCLSDDDIAAGLPARFLFAWPPERSRGWTEAEVPTELLADLRRTFDRLYRLPFAYTPLTGPDQSTAAPHEWRAVTLPFTAEARNVFASWYAHAARAQEEAPHHALQAALGKLPGYAARLALVLQLARWAEGAAESREIDVESVCLATSLADWFANEAARVYRLQDSERDERALRRLQQYIERQGGLVTLRKVIADVRPYRTKTAAEQALGQLVERGWCDWTKLGAERGVRMQVGAEGAKDVAA